MLFRLKIQNPRVSSLCQRIWIGIILRYGAKIYSKANKNFCLHSSFFDKVSATDYVKRCFHFLRILGLVLLYNHLRASMLIKKNIMHCVRFPFHYSFQTCFIKLFNFFLTFFNFPIERYKIYIGKFLIDFFFLEYFSCNFKVLLHL